MKKEDLYKELGNIDPNYIEEADEPAKKPVMWRRWAVAAAAFAVAVTAVSYSPSAQAAIKKIFSFIPGMSISEQNDTTRAPSGILYSMDGDPVTQTNGKVTVTLENAYVSDFNVDIVYKITLDFIKEDDIKYNATANDLQKLLDDNGVSSFIKVSDNGSPFGPSFNIVPDVIVAGKACESPDYYGGGSRTEMTNTVRVTDLIETIEEYGVNLPINLTIGDLSFDVKLKPIEFYDSIDQIGPTAMRNNISLTVVPRWDDDTLYIKMYSLNYSEFAQVYGYIQYAAKENGDDILPYLVIGGQEIPAGYNGGDGTEFYFDLGSYGFTDEEKTAAELHVPVVEVLDNEDIVLNFKVKKDGTIDFPKKVSLKYADLNITNMTVGSEKWDESIGIEFTATDKQDNIHLSEIGFRIINGKNIGGTASWTENENGQWKAAFGNDRIKLNDYRSVTLSSPHYILSDEYVFTLD